MSEDEAAIKQIEILWDEAWNRHDAEGLVSLLSEDADFVTVAGVWTKNRAEFRRLMERLQHTQFKDSIRKTTEAKVRLVQPDVAIVHTRFTIVGARDPDGNFRPPLEGMGTRVVRKQHGRWETLAVQYTNIVSPGR
jgi:uncharacterized protein (TIGR02246 family)